MITHRETYRTLIHQGHILFPFPPIKYFLNNKICAAFSRLGNIVEEVTEEHSWNGWLKVSTPWTILYKTFQTNDIWKTTLFTDSPYKFDMNARYVCGRYKWWCECARIHKGHQEVASERTHLASASLNLFCAKSTTFLGPPHQVKCVCVCYGGDIYI